MKLSNHVDLEFGTFQTSNLKLWNLSNEPSVLPIKFGTCLATFDPSRFAPRWDDLVHQNFPLHLAESVENMKQKKWNLALHTDLFWQFCGHTSTSHPVDHRDAEPAQCFSNFSFGTEAWFAVQSIRSSESKTNFQLWNRTLRFSSFKLRRDPEIVTFQGVMDWFWHGARPPIPVLGDEPRLWSSRFEQWKM